MRQHGLPPHSSPRRRASEPGTLPYLIRKPVTMARLSVRRRRESCVRRCFQGRGLTGLSIPSRAFSAILSTYTSPQATENAEHKLRDVLIEILNRLPHSKLIERIPKPGLERVWQYKVQNKPWTADQLAIWASLHSPMCKM